MARVALPIVGAVVGSFFGPAGTQIGFMIGSALGSIVDPQKFPGPKLGDLAVQTSRDGIPIPLPWGVVAMAGNIIQMGPVSIVKKKQKAGKGGPTTTEERQLKTFAIGVAEGPIKQYLRIWENEKLVYDVRPGSTLVAESAEFAAGLRFYLGTESQLPDPELEAITGARFTPAYRGFAYVVFVNKDITSFGSIPQYRFELNAQVAEVATSTLYPIESIDGVNGDVTQISAELRTILFSHGLVEGADGDAAILSMELRSILLDHTLLEGVDGSQSIQSMELRSILLDHTLLEGVDGSQSIQSMALDTVLLQTIVDPEGVDGDVSILGMVLQ